MSILAEIVDRVEAGLDAKQRAIPAAELRATAESAPPRPGLIEALTRPGTSVIAEAKRASPSKGTLREPYDPVALAREYEEAGARAISVLTEPDFFRGAPEHLRAVVAACELPVLRKDFLVDPYQVWEARSWGASAALLIVAVLDDARLRDFRTLLEELELDALVEVHTEREAERALETGARLVGVNNRDLRTFETDRSATARIARLLPDEVTLVSESGIFERDHVLEVEAAGAEAVLVGEALLVSDSPGRRVRALRGKEGVE